MAGVTITIFITGILSAWKFQGGPSGRGAALSLVRGGEANVPAHDSGHSHPCPSLTMLANSSPSSSQATPPGL